MARPVLTLPPKINLTGGPFGTGDTIYAMCVKINTWIDQLESVLEYVDSVNADMEDIETAIETINQSITLAQKWASEAVDVIVSDGEYSAKHYATKAQEHAADLASALSQVSASLTTIQGIGSDVDAALATIQGIQTSVNTALSQAQAAAAQAVASAGSAAASEAVATAKANEAATSATTAQTAATQAAGYASDAEDSAVAAASSALTAGGSATSASGSAALAATARDEAQTARNQAVSAASDAADSETNAATSAGAASVSAGNASTSATQASTSAATATTKATEASTHADAAAVSASDASDSADAAALSATQAGTHAGNAASSATAASVSETNAAGSEAAAAASASDASDSADAAAVSATQAGTHSGNAASSASAAAVSAGQAADSAQQALDAVGSLNFPTIQSGDALKLLQVNATEDGYQFATVVLPTDSDDVPEGTTNLYLTAAERSKLSGIAAGATANQTDAHLLDRANHTGTQAIATVSGLQAELDSKAASAHGHAIGDVTGLQDALDAKAAASHTHLWAHITDKPATFTPSAHDHDGQYYTKAQVDTSLSGKAAASHSHAIGDVTGLQDALDGKAASGHGHTWAQITDKPSAFTPSSHTHLWADITDKPSTFTPSTHNHDERYYTETEVDTLLSGKSDTGHSHSWAQITSKPSTFTPSAHSHAIGEITGLQAALDGKAASSHNHDASQITTGTVAAARLGSGSSITTKFLRGDSTWQEIEAGGGSIESGDSFPVSPDDDMLFYRRDLLKMFIYYSDGNSSQWVEISGSGYNITASGGSVSWDSVTDKPSQFTPSSHTHLWSEITDKPAIEAEIVEARGDRSSLHLRISTISNFASPNAGGYITGEYYDNAFQGANGATLALANNRIDLAPFYTSTRLRIDMIGVAISTAAASSVGRVLIYGSNSEGWPDDLLFYGPSDMDFSTTGYKSHSIDFTFDSGRQYWVGIHSNGTATMRRVATTSAVNLGLSSNTGASQYTVLRRTVTYASGAPDPWGDPSSDLTANIAPPSIRMRAAALP